MKYIAFILLMTSGLAALAQSDQSYMIKMATDAGIKRPVPQAFASLMVKRPIKMDSLSLEKLHNNYVQRMRAGTILEVGGTLFLVSHILVAAFVQNFNFPGVVTLATIGVASMTTGSILLPISASERHRYKKSLKISLAQRGM